MGCCGKRKLVKFEVDGVLRARKYRSLDKMKADILSHYPTSKKIIIIEIGGKPQNEVIKDE